MPDLVRADLLSGTVTFLFTDVEGSTKLLHELGEESYAEALAEHRKVIREACATEGGIEVDTQGDAFFFAFPTAPGALAAAEAFTEQLAFSGPIQVRVGLHTGTPLLTEEGYVGHDVHRAARIAAAGHGGQVLVSASTASLVGLELTDLGEHRFKDLGAAERVFQLGEGAFPALKSLYATTLPVPATPFLGREQELAEVASLLSREDARLVTLTGPGGTGKTRLALQAAAEASDNFPDGVYWVPLAPLRDPSLLETTLAQALEVSEQPGTAITETIVKSFASRRSLLVLDNCEHLADAVAALLRALLEGCPSLVVAASSRERLGLRSERVYPVPPMAAPDGELLFRERALAVLPDFVPDEYVAAICEAVDGLPLAIELAAARVRSLSTQAIRERLSERLPLLTSRDRDLEERQRTLEATIAWSYDLLDREEQRVLRALSVFAGGCTLEAAEAVAGADLDLLESLLDKSLLRHRIDEAGQDRYWMLETIREYAATRCILEEEHDTVSRSHTAFFADLAQKIVPATANISDAQLASYRADAPNFRLAHGRAVAEGDVESALRLVHGLARTWDLLGEVTASYALALASLDLLGGPREDRAYALMGTAALAGELGDTESARRLYAEAETLLAQLGDARGLAFACARRAYSEFILGDYEQAVALAERAVDVARELGDARLESVSKGQLGLVLIGAAVDELPLDRDAAERSRALCEARVHELAGQGLSLAEASALRNLGLSLYILGELGESLAATQRSLALRLELGDRVSGDLFNLGLALVASGEHALGVKLVSVAQRQEREEEVVPQALDRTLHARFATDAHATLGDEGYEAAVREGEAMTIEQAVELAFSLSADG